MNSLNNKMSLGPKKKRLFGGVIIVLGPAETSDAYVRLLNAFVVIIAMFDEDSDAYRVGAEIADTLQPSSHVQLSEADIEEMAASLEAFV